MFTEHTHWFFFLYRRVHVCSLNIHIDSSYIDVQSVHVIAKFPFSLLYFLDFIFICKMSSSLKRASNKIKQEMQERKNNQSDHYNDDLFISLLFSFVVCLNHCIYQRKFLYLFTTPVDVSNLFVWQETIIGLENSPYSEGLFPITIHFSKEYPCKPMRVIYFWSFAKLVYISFFLFSSDFCSLLFV